MGWDGPIRGLDPVGETGQDLTGILVNDDAEPADAGVSHTASEELIEIERGVRDR